MKKFFVLLLVVVMALAMTACSSKCKESGCSEDVYEDGYCEIHYAAHALEDALGELGDLLG